jgi:hypothetical protein
VSDGVIFVFGDEREAKKAVPVRVPLSDSPVSPPVATVTEAADRPAPPARVPAAAPQQTVAAAPPVAALKHQKQQQGGVDAHPLLAIVAFAELLIDAINPTAGQTRKIKRSSMANVALKADARTPAPSTYVAPTGVLGRASLPGVVLSLVFTAVSGVVRQVATKSNK